MMNKIAILPLKEMPVSCISCKYFHGYNETCMVSKIYMGGLNVKYRDTRHPNCPLKEIDLDKLKSAVRKIEIGFAIMKIEDDNWAWNTIKSTIDKLKSVK